MSLPSYSSLRRDIEAMINFMSRAAVAERTKHFGGMPNMVQHEGDTARIIQTDGEEYVIDYKEISAERIITDDEIKRMTVEDIFALAQGIGTEMGDAQVKGMFDTIKEATEQSGNVVKSSSKKMTMDDFFATIEKINIDFDDNGNPIMPTMYIHPSMKESVENLFIESETPENEKRHKEIMQKKKEEFDARESRRKLVE